MNMPTFRVGPLTIPMKGITGKTVFHPTIQIKMIWLYEGGFFLLDDPRFCIEKPFGRISFVNKICFHKKHNAVFHRSVFLCSPFDGSAFCVYLTQSSVNNLLERCIDTGIHLAYILG